MFSSLGGTCAHAVGGALCQVPSLFSWGYIHVAINYIKHTEPSVFMNTKEAVEGGKVWHSCQEKRQEEAWGESRGCRKALTPADTLGDARLVAPRSCGGAAGGRRAELRKLSVLEGREGTDATGND